MIFFHRTIRLMTIGGDLQRLAPICTRSLLNIKPLTPSMATISQTRCISDKTDPNPNKKPIDAKFMEDGTRMPMRQRLKNMIVIYGPLGTVLHIALSLTFLGITYVVVRFGVDASGFLSDNEYFGETYLRILATGGTFGLAYAIYKAMMPLRIMVTLLVTPRVARKFQEMGLIKRRF